jgi:hypothetical protein
LGVAIGTDVQAYSATLASFSGKAVPSGVIVGDSDSQTLSNKTLTSPTINSPTFGGTATMGASFLTRGSTVTASGTSVDFTSLPSWVNRITVMFRNISTNGSSNILVQLGTSSGVTTSGYVSTSIDFDGSGAVTTSSTSGLVMKINPSSNTINGIMTIAYMGSNAWVNNHTVSNTTSIMSVGGGTIGLGGTLDRVRITRVNGTDTFNSGSVNILFE